MWLQGLQHCICGFISLQFNFGAANIVCGNTNILSVVWCSGGSVDEPLRNSTISAFNRPLPWPAHCWKSLRVESSSRHFQQGQLHCENWTVNFAKVRWQLWVLPHSTAHQYWSPCNFQTSIWNEFCHLHLCVDRTKLKPKIRFLHSVLHGLKLKHKNVKICTKCACEHIIHLILRCNITITLALARCASAA